MNHDDYQALVDDIKLAIEAIGYIYPTVNLYDEPTDRLAHRVATLVRDNYLPDGKCPKCDLIIRANQTCGCGK